MYKLLCKRDSGRMVQTVRHYPFFKSFKITFSHNVFILLFFLYLIKVEHPSTKLHVLSRSARLERNNIERGGGCTHIKHLNIMGVSASSGKKKINCGFHPWEKWDVRAFHHHHLIQHELYKITLFLFVSAGYTYWTSVNRLWSFKHLFSHREASQYASSEQIIILDLLLRRAQAVLGSV